MKVHLQGVAETLLIPFYARVYGSQKFKKRFYDEKALEAFEKINYDFSKFENGKMSIYGCIARSIILDREAKKFIEKFPNAKCISIGCGFDTRFNRIDNQKITWYGIDFPEVINLREEIFSTENRENYIACNALEENWAKSITDNNEEVLIILEGILMFFKEDEVKKIFELLKKYFPNATILAEFSSRYLINHQKHHDALSKMKAKIYWGIAKSKDIEKLSPNVKFLNEWNLTNEMLPFSPFFLTLFYIFIHKINNRIVKLKIK